MHTLTSTLQTEIRKPSRTLALSAIVTGQPPEAHGWEFAALHTDALADTAHGSTIAPSGALYQVRLDGSTVKARRIADPSAVADWTGSTWITIATSGTATPGVAIASDPTLGTDSVYVFWVDSTDGRTIRASVSTDGVTWTNEVVIVENAAYQVRHVAGVLTAGEIHCVYVLDQQSGAPDEFLVSIERVAAVWGTRVLQATARYNCNGIGAARGEGLTDIHVVVADGEGTNGLERRLSVATFDTVGNTWTAASSAIIKHSSGSGFDFRRPRLAMPTTASPRHALTWVESYAGSGATPAYERPMLCLSPSRLWFPEWVPWDQATQYGFDLLRAAAAVWYLVGAKYVHRAPSDAITLAANRVDVSADVASIRIDTARANGPTTAHVRLDDRGTYTTAAVSGATKIVRPGSRLSIKLGYRTSAGAEGIWQAPLWIDRVDHVFADDRWWLDIRAIDAWSILDRLHPAITTQFTAATTIQALLERILWRVVAVAPTTPTSLNISLSGAIWNPSRNFADIARELLDLAGTRLRFRTDQAATDGAGWASALAQALETTAQASTYTYGTDHPILALTATLGGQRINHVAAAGATAGPYLTDSHDHTAIRRWWRRLTSALVDRRIGSLANVQTAGDAALRQDQAADEGDSLEVPLNPAQEIGDTIAITSARAGLSAALYVIVGQRISVVRIGNRPHATSRYDLAAL